MSKQVPAKEESPAAATAFVVAKINDKWVRFKDKDSVPCGVDLVTEVIAAEMTAAGVRTPRGGVWRPSLVAAILRQAPTWSAGGAALRSG